MKAIKYIFLMIFVLFSAGKVNAQNATDKIDLKNLKSAFLEQLIKERIVKLRDSLKLHGIQKDSVLEQAAKNHVLFIRKTERIESHVQPDPQFATLEKRVEFYKGTQEKVDELMEKIYIDQPTQ